MDAVKHISSLGDIIKSYRGLVVAASGGMDSTFLSLVAHSVLGDGMKAVSVLSRFSIRREIELFSGFARDRGIPHEIIEVDVMGVSGITQNGRDRCYHCKKAIFTRIKELAARQGYGIVADGSNLSDLGDFRPGKKALEELGVVSPLSLAGFTRDLVRESLDVLGVDVPVKHSNSCLATRVEYGTRISDEVLDMVDAGEQLLHGMGFEPVRVRYHGGMARVELSIDCVKILINDDEKRIIVAEGLRRAGFSFVTIDIEGFRSGSMN
jgi:uncharacterized protein